MRFIQNPSNSDSPDSQLNKFRNSAIKQSSDLLADDKY